MFWQSVEELESHKKVTQREFRKEMGDRRDEGEAHACAIEDQDEWDQVGVTVDSGAMATVFPKKLGKGSL